MPTDAELRDQAVAELKLTTAGWRKSNGNPNYPSGVAPPTTHWGKAMALLEQIASAGPAPDPLLHYDVSVSPASGLIYAWPHHTSPGVPTGQWGGIPCRELRTSTSWSWYGIYELTLDSSWPDTVSTYGLPFDGHSVGGEPGWNTVSSVHLKVRNGHLWLQHEPNFPQNEWDCGPLSKGVKHTIELDLTLGRTDGTTPQAGRTRVLVDGAVKVDTGRVNNVARENNVNQTRYTILDGIYCTNIPSTLKVTFSAGLWGKTRAEALADKPLFSGESLSPTATLNGVGPPPAPPPPPAPSTTFYGAPWNADGLANLEIGKEIGRVVAYRVCAARSGQINAGRFFFVYRTGYGLGDGGDVKIELRRDTAGVPDMSTAGSSVVVSNPMATNFPAVAFPNFAVTAGEVFHIVFTNVSADPVRNYVSIDDISQSSPGAQMQPEVPDAQLAVVWKSSGSSAWVVNRKHSPIYELGYADGSKQGIQYVDFMPSARVSLPVTQTINAPRAFSKVHARVSGTGTVTIEVAGISKTVQTSGGWVSVDIPVPAGPGQVKLSGAGLTIFPYQKGTGYGFADPFPGGRGSQADRDWPVYLT